MVKIVFPEHFTEVQKRRIKNQIQIGRHHGFDIGLSDDKTRLIWTDKKTGKVTHTESVENYKPS